MRILLTGGAGFIGSAVVRQLIREDDADVINVDKLTYAGNLRSLAEVAEHPRYRFEQVDAYDARAVTQLFVRHRQTAVMHLAAESHVDRSIDGPAEFIRTRILGPFTLLQAAHAYICGLLDELLPGSPHIPHASLITFVADRPGHDHRNAIDAGKMARELGWAPRETFESGLRQTVHWYLGNEAWCRDVQSEDYRRERLGLGLPS